MGLKCPTIRVWVARGSFPLPHWVIEQTMLYRVDLVESFLATGR